MTFSLAARCERTGQMAVSVCSSSPAVGARCGHARAGVGAVTTQNVTDPRLGPRALDLLALGADASQVCAVIQARAPHAAYRQFTVVDATGHSASFSGAQVLGIHGAAHAPNAVSAGNLLAHSGVPDAILAAFLAAPGPLGTRVLTAMQAGLDAGGEAGPVHSAALLVVDQAAWPLTDLRVDWSEQPLGDLQALWMLWQPQADAYLARALNPDAAPSYGVPGDR